jgi:hypothetical protein
VFRALPKVPPTQRSPAFITSKSQADLNDREDSPITLPAAFREFDWSDSMRLIYLGPAVFLAAGALALAADPVPEPPAAGVVPQRANTPPSEEQPPNGPALSPPEFDNTDARVIENTDPPMSPQPGVGAPTAPAAPQPTAPPVAVQSHPASNPVANQDCAPVTPVAALPMYAACPTSACGPFGPPMFGNAPGPGRGVAVPPVPPAYLAGPTGFYGPAHGGYYGPSVGGIHDRYPYYSYRRPWYTAGPASANVTIVW